MSDFSPLFVFLRCSRGLRRFGISISDLLRYFEVEFRLDVNSNPKSNIRNPTSPQLSYRIKMLKHPFIMRGVDKFVGEVLAGPVFIMLSVEP